MHNIHIRPAVMAERQALEALQRRASLNNPGDRDALLANPDAIELRPDQIAAGQVFVAERDGAIVGFSRCLEPSIPVLASACHSREGWLPGRRRILTLLLE